MEDFRIVLIVMGALAILAVLVHGLRTMRRQHKPKLAEQPIADVYRQNPVRDSDGFDQDGIGEVRVRNSKGESVTAKVAKQASHLFSDVGEPERRERKEPRLEPAMAALDDDPVIDMEPMQAVVADEPVARKSLLRPKPAQPKSKVSTPPKAKAQPKPALKESVRSEPTVKEPVRQEPVNKQPSAPAKSAEPEAPTPPPQPQDVLVINVVAPEGHAFPGPLLFDALRSVGLRFGEMDIFHCHAEAEGRGPALFSLVNMVKPGTFSLENIDQFSTQGISLFMTLPAPGEPLPAFELMLDSATSLALKLQGLLLDAGRQPLTEQTVDQYRERIHTFERNQLLNAS